MSARMFGSRASPNRSTSRRGRKARAPVRGPGVDGARRLTRGAAGRLAAVAVAVLIWAVPATAGGITGFRSARFGMTEAMVLEAITADFGVPPGAVERAVHPYDKTVTLVIEVDDLVAGTGRTQIAYILGYHSRRLIQVNLVWQQPADAEFAGHKVVKAAQTMITRFGLRGIPRDPSVANARLPDGSILMFRGVDAEGRLALIRLNRPETGDGAAAATDGGSENWWLRVSLMEDAEAPDVYRIEDGAF